jgi:SAM-dependent methyltransferase
MPAVTTSTPRRARPHRQPARAEELAVLKRLWAEQLAFAESSEVRDEEGLAYLAAHFGMEITLERHLRVLDALMPWIGGRVLEWGCRHGLDACVYRLRLGGSVELYGCDVCDGNAYRPFFAFSGMLYTRLDHPWRLPYDDAAFDVATSNGVLEHVPEDRASLGEIHRVLRPGGTLAITCLPNRFSYTEAMQRLRGGTAHERLYTLRGTRRLLRAAGFEVITARRFLMLPTMLNGFPDRVKAAYQRAGRLVWAANDILERVPLLNWAASNLLLIARKPADPARGQP